MNTDKMILEFLSDATKCVLFADISLMFPIQRIYRFADEPDEVRLCAISQGYAQGVS